MLIRNVKSFADLERKRNLQAQLLQLQIDNESVLESRVKDFKNPNKPPPLPPQYKTNAEIQQDTQLQQKEVINNLTSISGVNNFDALSVSQQLAQLPDGVGNYLKFNKFFPVIRKRIEDINKSAYSPSAFMKIIEETFEQIDEGLYLNIGGSTATMVFNQAIGSGSVIPSGQDVIPLLAQLAQLKPQYNLSQTYQAYQGQVSQYQQDMLAYQAQIAQQAQQAGGGQAIQAPIPPLPFSQSIPAQVVGQDGSLYGQLVSRLFAISVVNNSPFSNDPDFSALFDIVKQLCNNSPSRDDLTNIDVIQQMERMKLQKQINKLIKEGLPDDKKIVSIINDLDPVVFISAVEELNNGGVFTIPQTFSQAYFALTNAIKSMKSTTLANLKKFKDDLRTELAKLNIGGLAGQLSATQQATIASAQAVVAQKGAKQQARIDDKQITLDAINDFRALPDDPQTTAIYEERVLALGLLKRGSPFWGSSARGKTKDLFDFKVDKQGNREAGVGYINASATGANYRIIDDAEIATIPVGQGEPQITRQTLQNYMDGFINLKYVKTGAKGGASPSGAQSRYTNAQLLQMLEPNLVSIEQRIANEKKFIPLRDATQRVVASQGFGVRKGGMVMCPAVYDPVMGKDGKMYSNKCQASTSGAGMPKPDTIHIDINSHNGENYKMSGDGFISRKIKIGKGIEVQEQPRYKTFGKYIVHIPHLENDNVLNFKFPSMGSIPTLKPVNVDDNFKEFIIDILNTGKVSQRHYDSLTEPEKAHFNKIIKGAGLTNSLQFKTDSKIDEKKDIKRLDVLLGEINAGNDNDKLRKECKELIKKCVNNGSIPKHKGMDFLLQIE
jgi:hypothetical protein